MSNYLGVGRRSDDTKIAVGQKWLTRSGRSATIKQVKHSGQEFDGSVGMVTFDIFDEKFQEASHDHRCDLSGRENIDRHHPNDLVQLLKPSTMSTNYKTGSNRVASIGDDDEFAELLWAFKFHDDVEGNTLRRAALVAYIDARPTQPTTRRGVPDVDWLSNVIRHADGALIGAGALAEKIVEAMHATQPTTGSVPDGWPTTKMITAGFGAGVYGRIGSGFRAMLAAAPTIRTVELADCGNCGSQVTVPVSYFAAPSAPGLTEWAEYLKEGETPLQRLRREIKDSDSLATLLAAEKERLHFLHSTNCDAEGWEWGVARIRRAADGRIEYLWGLSDHSDIDAAIRALRSQPEQPKGDSNV